MRVFVTGGLGFIGSHAVRQMAAEGDEVAVLARPGESRRRISDVTGKVQIVEGDLAETSAVGGFLACWRPEACLHCAWYAEPGLYLESVKNIDCMIQSLALLEELARSGCRRVVMLGTCAEYDANAGLLKENSAFGPATLYAAAKLATALVAEKRAAQAQIRLAWARMFYLFGPGEDDRRMVPAAIRALIEGREFAASWGSQVRDYLYVEDAAAGLVHLVRTTVAGSFNVCSGEPVTVRRILEIIGEATGRSGLIRLGALPQRPWEPPFLCGDSSRLRALGWSPKHNIEDALRLTVEYWRTQAERSQVDG